MSKQLSLFHFPGQPPAEPGGEGGNAALQMDGTAVDELFRNSRRWRSSRELIGLLDFIGRMPAYSPLNGFLIFLQDPEATFLATARGWERRYQRQLKPGARPVVILAPMSPVQFVFDVRHTEGTPFPAAAIPAARPANRLPPRIYDATLRNCEVLHIAVRGADAGSPAAERALRATPAMRKRHPELDLAAGQRYVIQTEAGLRLEETYTSLTAALAHVFCGHLGTDADAWWADRQDLDLERMELEAAATAYLVGRRQGLAAATGLLLAEWSRQERQVPAFSLHAVLQSAQHIERMGKAAWRVPRKTGR